MGEGIFYSRRILMGITPPVTGITATGGTITEATIDGDEYIIHTFNTSSNFQVLSNPANQSIDILVVGAGGGGGVGWGGGGGAGGVVTTSITPTETTYAVSIGNGGEGAKNGNLPSADWIAAINGENTTFDSITALGGGRGAAQSLTAQSGGSGGGATYSNDWGTPGTGLQPSSADGGFGNDGGIGQNQVAGGRAAGSGGGGASTAGSQAPNNDNGGAGGVGIELNYNGTLQHYAGGGGGGIGNNSTGSPGVGGLGGGGNGGKKESSNGEHATPNTGGGGGGGGNTGGNGGSGIVIVKYLKEPPEEIELAGLEFDGVDDYISVPNAAYQRTNSFSMEAWVKRPNLTERTQIMLKRGNNGVGYWWQILDNGDVTYTHGGVSDYNLNYTINDTNYHHLVLTKDGNTVRLYDNGSLVSTTTVGNLNHTTQPLVIQSVADSNGVPTAWYRGFIAEFRYWSTVLTASQVQENMNKQLCGNETGLVGYWRLDDIVSGEVIDYAGNNNGTVFSNPTIVTNTGITLTPC